MGWPEAIVYSIGAISAAATAIGFFHYASR